MFPVSAPPYSPHSPAGVTSPQLPPYPSLCLPCALLGYFLLYSLHIQILLSLHSAVHDNMNSGVRSEFKFWLSPWEACSTSLGLGFFIYKVGILTDSTPAWPLRPSPQLEVSSPSSEPHCSAAPPLGLPGLTLGQAPLLGSGTQRRTETTAV